jgi:tetratricopeptide (TPR) repeat protein
MKKIAWAALGAFFVVSLGGCAFPEKRRVSSPPSTSSPNQSSSVYIQDSNDPEGMSQVRSSDINDQQQVDVDESIEVVLPSAVYVNDRIFEYGRKLDRWKELDSQSVTMNLKEEETVRMVDCFRRLQSVLNGYSGLRTKLIQAQQVEVAAKISNDEIFELQKNDVDFLESSCGRLLVDSEDKSVGWSQREEGADLNQLETLIDRYATNREYEEIIQVWSKIPTSQGGRVHLRTKILYGNALMYLHQEEKAAEIYQQVVDQMSNSDEQATDLVSLRKMLADIYTASGNYSSAAREYNKISEDYLNLGRLEEWSKLQLSILDREKDSGPELKEFSEILRDYLGFIPERDGYMIIWQTEKFQSSYPYSAVASNVDFIRDSVKAGADKWFNDFMTEVDKLASEKKFSKALWFLETMPTDIVSAEKQLLIKAKHEELLLAEAVENETGKMAKIQDLQNQWNNGMLLTKGGRYEEAIAVFTSLLGTEYSLKAENKIKEISLDAAKADRRKAAELFIRFTKTSELESKKKLLVESRKLLKNILIKYPEVEIVPKVVGNIQRVEQEMNAIDPNLVFMADRETLSVVQDDGIDRAFSMPATQTMTGEQTPIIETDLNPQLNQ